MCGGRAGDRRAAPKRKFLSLPSPIAQGYLPGTSTFLLSMSLVNAFLLVLVGLAAIISIMLRVGPFS